MPTQENPNQNSLTDLKRYLGTDESPVSNAEWVEFWKSLSDEEKAEFRNAELG
jgi:hypothetical protein